MKADFLEKVAQIMLHICFLKCANADWTFGSMTICNPIGPTTTQDINWQGNVPSTEHIQSKHPIENSDAKKAEQTIASLSPSLPDENYAGEENPWDVHMGLLDDKLSRCIGKMLMMRMRVKDNHIIPSSDFLEIDKLVNYVSEIGQIRRHAKTLKKRAGDICGPFVQNARHILRILKKEINEANDMIEQLLQRFDAKTNANHHNQTNEGLLENHQTQNIETLTYQKHTKQTKSIFDIAKFQDVYAGDQPNMLRSCGSIPLPYMNAAQLNTCKCYEKTCFSCTYELFDELLVQESITENELVRPNLAKSILGQVEADSSSNVGSTNLDLCNQTSYLTSTINQQEAKQISNAAQHSIESLPGYNAYMRQMEIASAYLAKLHKIKRCTIKIANQCDLGSEGSKTMKNIKAKNFFDNLKLKNTEFAVELIKISKDLMDCKDKASRQLYELKKKRYLRHNYNLNKIQSL